MTCNYCPVICHTVKSKQVNLSMWWQQSINSSHWSWQFLSPTCLYHTQSFTPPFIECLAHLDAHLPFIFVLFFFLACFAASWTSFEVALLWCIWKGILAKTNTCFFCFFLAAKDGQVSVKVMPLNAKLSCSPLWRYWGLPFFVFAHHTTYICTFFYIIKKHICLMHYR